VVVGGSAIGSCRRGMCVRGTIDAEGRLACHVSREEGGRSQGLKSAVAPVLRLLLPLLLPVWY
jgi:hypothetical protein